MILPLPWYSPEVHAEAERLLQSSVSDSEREQFVRSGYAAAQARDRAYREEAGAQERALLQRDWDFVRLLSTEDPGAQVRLSASYAVREGATEDDLVEFFAYGWATGARLDIEAFRMRNATDNMRWRAAVTRLIADAEAAEQAAREAAGEAKERAKAEAVHAWRQVSDRSTPAHSAWREAEQFALRQAENWRTVLSAANAAKGPNWTSIIEPARTSEADWLAERDAATRQAEYWNVLLERARDAENRIQETL